MLFDICLLLYRVYKTNSNTLREFGSCTKKRSYSHNLIVTVTYLVKLKVKNQTAVGHSSTGISPLQVLLPALFIACDASNARTMTIEEYHYPD